ncbi:MULTISPECIES: branched-chain amino acid ABC transporter permease [unclassified Chelatococcus]|uniref:branched-chain amino acid ABC transporter permease n=1 Tax=unclassified Chelatococcus TaxID=2638111 RepID=UPI001BCE2F2B|nr:MULTISPECIES: branched-chain amino acid ABC transporter permease [unclassified Chelatococcus]CAH1647989.1 Branched-chain amino acid ABC transporter permease [Hyphomicrobiales bacterium]MBS7742107.1 branched-chain amino acid ABC transporter permease [Chelatococcus sp. HY11]MBX3542775.1 branched-chain amino acid ABC transporter permease [Chelatococcus sp.]MCO5075010.1 branched-chain amino acid ABC transporter permease [Chelatococcus sp.]CAH1690157.1 Branched-chain amino acid ABC transporter p
MDNKARLALGAVLLVLALAAPFVLYPTFAMKLLCFALFAVAFNLLIGFTGLLSFGHAAFFGTGGYIAAHAAKVWGLTPELAILTGMAASAVFGVIIGFLAIRRKGIYFAMITLAMSQMIFFLYLQARFTGGEDGLQRVPRGHLFGLIDLSQPLAMYYTVLAIFLIGFFIVWRVVHSPYGQVLKAIREHEPRAISLGYDVDRYKLVVFVLSATIAGMAGGTKAIVFQLASLTDVTWQASGQVVLMTLLGGIGTMLGPVVGAFLVVSLENYLAAYSLPVPVVIGAVFVASVLLFRRGIVGEIEHRLARNKD